MLARWRIVCNHVALLSLQFSCFFRPHDGSMFAKRSRAITESDFDSSNLRAVAKNTDAIDTSR